MSVIHMLVNLYIQHFLVHTKMQLKKDLKLEKMKTIIFGKFHIFQLTHMMWDEIMRKLFVLTVNPVKVVLHL